ncbi:MAG: phosphatase PAP2 family protein [Candidatus Acidiferrales bacterium]
MSAQQPPAPSDTTFVAPSSVGVFVRASVAPMPSPNVFGEPVPAASSSWAPIATSTTPEKTISWKQLPWNILRDEKRIWLFPLQVGRGEHLFPTVSVVGVTTGLIVADKYDTPYFVHTTDFHGFSRVFSGTTTGAAIAIVPASFYIVGLVRKDSYAEQTALLAAEAYAASAIPHVAAKLVTRRFRPLDVPPNQFSDTFFRSHVSIFGKGSSFPSGHATGAFSIATVIAERYRNHRWVPWVAYGAAGLISFSRIPAKEHFPSEVFFGAALGYAIARYDVMRGVN